MKHTLIHFCIMVVKTHHSGALNILCGHFVLCIMFLVRVNQLKLETSSERSQD